MNGTLSPDHLFQIANPLALVGWLCLLAAPVLPLWSDRLAGWIIPGVLSVAYSAVVLAFWSGATGGFGTLHAVMTLFTSPWIALAGWLHYLAFDLALGAWQVRTARRQGIPHLLMIPCLVLTFLFGPAGFLCFLALRAVNRPLPLPEAASRRA